MQRVYKTNLRCQACLKTIAPLLDNAKEIANWEVDLKHPAKLLSITLANDATNFDLPLQFESAGYEATLFENTTNSDDAISALPTIGLDSGLPKKQFTLSKYRPLLLVAAYIVALTGFIEFQIGTFELMRAMSHVMGFFFLGFAFFKLLDVNAFANAFASYDILAKKSRLYAQSYPFVELFFGALCLSRQFPLLTNLMVISVMGIGLVGVTEAVLNKRTIQCACLGTAFNLPMSFVTIVENGIMLLMAIVGLVAAF